MQHLDGLPLPPHLLPAQQPAQRAHVRSHVAPPHGALAHRHAAREAGPDPDDHPRRAGQPREGGNGRRVCHWMAQAWDQHTEAEADALRALGRPTPLHPHVWIERGRVEEESTAVAERLRDARVLVALRGGGERTGKLDSHWYTSGLSS